MGDKPIVKIPIYAAATYAENNNGEIKLTDYVEISASRREIAERLYLGDVREEEIEVDLAKLIDQHYLRLNTEQRCTLLRAILVLAAGDLTPAFEGGPPIWTWTAKTLAYFHATPEFRLRAGGEKNDALRAVITMLHNAVHDGACEAFDDDKFKE